ncbi:hypothetical protein BDV25DRAFT_141016 [Aspergillus avenaceus]|uniref:Uncharacterized protein n=1 Tax=Aspergillus avenaceus TaxID=36643 RepID=A0A5N6TSZ4_ASPAV|nr:hypothetical protein BDV25DRAFT_141016 [Aspergillus avenaceus]
MLACQVNFITLLGSVRELEHELDLNEAQLNGADRRNQRLSDELQDKSLELMPDYQLCEATVSDQLLVVQTSLTSWVEGADKPDPIFYPACRISESVWSD